MLGSLIFVADVDLVITPSLRRGTAASTSPNKAAVWSAGAVLLTGFLLAWFGATPFDDDARCPIQDYPEGTAIAYELSFTPPGATDCRASLPNGERDDRTVIPWRGWISLIPFALAAGLGVTAMASSGVRRRLGGMAGAAVLAALGVAVLFGIV
jgi:hypothetical protein